MEEAKRKGKELKNLTQKIEKELNGALLPAMKQLSDEMQRIHNPEETKAVEIYGKMCTISRTTDNRIFIKFNDTVSAKEFIDNTPIHTNIALIDYGQTRYNVGCIDGNNKGREQAEKEFREMKWYKRLFYK